ncbi:type I polyketide synthase [Aminobacter sp. BE322]|uniref:type I polyketide synthase n=1 Tax=unclassified Aminobacter TaxID=2644704 RepID=UPI003D2243B9
MTDSPDQFSPNDIAIVGMALRVPGARDVGQFWANLRDGVESIRDLTEEELLAAGEQPSRIHHPNYVRRTSELPAMEMFDAEFFGLSPKEAAIMDPQHRQFLECAWEAMEDAGRTPDSSGGPVGVFAGCGMGSYFYFNVCSNRQLVDQVGMFLLRHTGNDKDFLATRASFAFDLRGPSVNIQTACSTSLVAVHSACQSLLAGECEMALAGGVTIDLPHRRGYMYQEGEILSPDGRCRAFDHRAAGTVFGSGVGVVVLRRLSDAIADGDIVHAVIKGTAVNNDGASKAGYLAPSVNGQAEAIIEAQGLAGVDADSIQYVECHGTGTYLGDPIEIEALTQAFRQGTDRTGFCRVGSVKSNIGHLDTAAGVVSLIKASLAVKHGEIPPTLGFEKPNPAIAFERSPFVVNDRLTQWPQTPGPRRAAVNSLGVGGTNAHAIIEQAPSLAAGRSTAEDAPRLLVFAARNRKALDQATVRLGAELVRRPDLDLGDAAYTLFAGRKHFEHRRVVAVGGRADAVAVLSDPESKRGFTHSALDDASGPVFLFPGGGAQHVGMARALYDGDRRFRATVDEGISYLDPAAAAEIRRVWLDSGTDRADAEAAFLRPSVQLPAILITEVAVARWWIDRGVKPTALIGHSMGENAAACIAGVISLRDAVNLVRLRGELFDTVEPGGMLSVPLSAAALAEIMPPELDLASVNAPELCVVSGRNEDLDGFRAALQERGIDASRVAIDIAAHSRMLEPILGRFEAFLRGIRLNAPSIPIVSNLTGTWLTETEARDPLYWVRHLRSTVQFGKGVAVLAAEPGRVFVEVGPGRALSSLAKLQPSVPANQVINSLPHAEDDTDDRVHLLAALGRAWGVGLDVPLERLWEGSGARRVSLPTYPFQHQRYFIEPAAAASAEATEEVLRKLPDITDWGFRPTWRQSVADVEIDAGAEPTSFLVFLDRAGFGRPLVESLRGGGHRVLTVEVGDAFARKSAEAYALCPEDNRAGYDALLAAIAAEGALPQRILHLWLVTADESHRPGSSFFNRNQEQGFYSLVHLAQALGEAGASDLQLTVVGNGMQRVGDEPLPYPEKATVLGPGLVIPKEMPGTSVRLIDLQLPRVEASRGLFSRQTAQGQAAMAQLHAQLRDDLFAAPASEVVAYRDGRRWTRGYGRLPLAPAGEGRQGFRRQGVYIVTGGLGDLAQVMAQGLADEFDARVMLVGRSALPPRGQWPLFMRTRARSDRMRRAMERIVALEAAGHKVAYAAADVGNPEQMAAVVAATRAEFGEINGVIHTAGVVDDDLIQLKSVDAMEAVLAPKLHGTAVLDRVFRDVPLDLFVLFSSTSTDTAPAGQVDYVAANAYLNAYAESRAGDAGRRTVAVHWGIWNEVGLAARAVGRTDRSPGREPSEEPARGPFFRSWVEDAEGTPWLEAEIGPATHWMLDEHRMVSGEPVLPGTGYVELIAQAFGEYGLDARASIEDLVFLRPLVVKDGATRTIRVRMTPDADGHRIEVTASQAGDASFERFAEAFVRGRPKSARGGAEMAEAARRCAVAERAEGADALPSVQAPHVRFGPRWQVLRSVAFGRSEAFAELALPQAYRGDATLLHPALLDIATGFAMRLDPEYDGSVLWAPMSYGRIAVHAPLPDRVSSWVRLCRGFDYGKGYVAFDVSIADASGQVLVDIERFVMKRLDSDLGLVAPRAARDAGADSDHRQSPAALQLAAQVSQGILPGEGFEALRRALATGQPQPIVSSMDLEALRRRAAAPAVAAPQGGDQFERPELDSDYVAPRNDIERTLAGFWSELLGVDRIGVDDSFFDIGGHSLIAVRLFRMIRKQYAVDLPISVLFEAPTIAGCAQLIASHLPAGEHSGTGPSQPAPPAEKHLHLVAMSAGTDPSAAPVFICAGMFGNVLNLRQLAMRLGVDRPVYGLQARGLYGDQEPHATFEEMARDYLAEVRKVQPRGPYLLAGFSGGGLAAYEMAQQLRAEGEDVALVAMLDTPLPTQPRLTAFDRLQMKLQDLRRHKLSFVTGWIRDRRRWQAEMRDKREAAEAENAGRQFQNARIEAAFRAALLRYDLKPYPGRLLLLRPRLNILYTLSGGRRLQEGRNVALDDNGWTPYVAELEVQEVAGDHDSMVLEPYVRVLSERLRPRFAAALSEGSERLRIAAE